MRVLVIDDNEDVRELVTRTLERDGHVVGVAASVREAERAIAAHESDVIVLDLGLPDGSGMDLCRELRSRGSAVPILVLTAESQVARRVEGFDAGADDYLAKPFAVAELRARVRALGRRGPLPRALHLRRGPADLDFAARRAKLAGREVPVTAREWAVIELLAARGGRVVSRTEILEQIWGEVTDAGSGSLDVIVGRIRRKLGEGLVRTVRGEGYSIEHD